VKGCIVGLGSIGSRHLRNLEFLGVNDLVVLRRHGNPAYTTTHPVVSSHAEALAAKPDFAVICSPTVWHKDDALPFLQAGVPTLIEKPLACGRIPRLPGPAYMAYSLRYHPAYRKARDLLASSKIGRPVYAKAWNECYLPDWHPGEDYRQSYAARAELGGGLPHTLDHEIDWLNWCFAPSYHTTGMDWTGGLDSVAVATCSSRAICYACNVKAVCTLSMCRRKKSRGFEIVTDWGVLSYDWSVGLLRFHATEDQEDDAKTFCQCGNYDINQMYVDLMADFLLAVEGRPNTTPTVQAGYDSLAAMEISHA
jgi:predicted dehydrogenase